MERFIMQLLACAAEMSVVSLIYIGLLRLLKNRQQPVVRYYVWLALLIGFLTPFKPSFGSGAVTISAPEQAVAAVSSKSVQSSTFNIWDIVFIIWAALVVISLVHFAVRYKIFCKSIRRLSKPVDDQSQILANDIAASMGISPQVRVLVVKGLASPMMTGLLSPTILLPEREFSKAELTLVLRHELTHFKHKDLWFKLLFTACMSVYWFDPIMLLIERSIDRECEHFCDSSVMNGETTEIRKRYCESILNTASAQSRQTNGLRPVMATNFCISKNGLKHRLGLILSKRAKKKYLAVCIAAVALTAVSGSLIAFAESEKAEQAQPTPNNAQVIAVSSPQAPKHTEATYAQTTRKTSEQSAETTAAYAQTTRKAAETSTVTYEVTTALVRTEQQQSSPVTWEAETTVTAE